MSNRKQEIISNFSRALYDLKAAVDWFIAVASLDVNTLRRTMDQVVTRYEVADAIYQDMIAKAGSAAAVQTILSDELFSAPADVGAGLASIQSAKNTLVTTYDGIVPVDGAKAFTFDDATERHVEVAIPAGVKATLDADFTTLQTAIAPFTP